MELVYYYARSPGWETATATRVCVADNDADVPAIHARTECIYYYYYYYYSH